MPGELQDEDELGAIAVSAHKGLPFIPGGQPRLVNSSVSSRDAVRYRKMNILLLFCDFHHCKRRGPA